MGLYKNMIALAALIVMCSSQPVDHPVLVEASDSVLFTVSDPAQPLTLPCKTTSRSQNVKFSWRKNGKPFDLKSHADVINRENEGTIVFLQPKDGDEGQYQCFAESNFGVASTRTISVKKAYLNAPKVTAQRHKPVEGQPFKLDCPIPDAYSSPKITWRVQFESDPSVSHEVLDPRITVSPDGTLWFSSVNKTDAYSNFKYVCLASSPATSSPVNIAEHYIEDVAPNDGKDYSELVEQFLSQDTTAKVGDVLMLYCIYGGTPLTPPDWYKDGQNVNNEPGDRVTRHNRSRGKRLLIRDVWLSDQGTYTCKVDNKVGKPKEHSMHLTVVSAPRFDKKPQAQLSVKQGDTVTLPCQVLSVPTAEITWTYNARPLPDAVEVQHSSSGNRTVADIHFSGVKKSDTGYYGCRAANEHGDVYSETLLFVA